MGILDDAKETAAAAGRTVGRKVEDGPDRAKDTIDEVQAEADVKRAEAERDATRARNEAKEKLRDS